MRKYRIKQIDAFTDRAFGGNPAGVVPVADGLSDVEMQSIAVEMNLSETAFILPSEKADFKIRWFTPKKEVLFCGHATVASLHALAEEGEFGMDKEGEFSFKIETMVDILKVSVQKSAKHINIILQSPEINLINEKMDEEKFSEALKIDIQDIDHSHPIMRDKTLNYIYIVLKNLSTLKNVRYDYDKLESFGKEYNITGFTLISTETFEKDFEVHSRFFSPAYGIKEDPVTGSAQGPLGAYLIVNKLLEMSEDEIEINSEQGDIMGRPGRLIVKVTKKEEGCFTSQLIGEARTVLNGEIILN
jgi:trans-2,3-dihydro-3-hydroxyanthranilate isomerase